MFIYDILHDVRLPLTPRWLAVGETSFLCCLSSMNREIKILRPLPPLNMSFNDAKEACRFLEEETGSRKIRTDFFAESDETVIFEYESDTLRKSADAVFVRVFEASASIHWLDSAHASIYIKGRFEQCAVQAFGEGGDDHENILRGITETIHKRMLRFAVPEDERDGAKTFSGFWIGEPLPKAATRHTQTKTLTALEVGQPTEPATPSLLRVTQWFNEHPYVKLVFQIIGAVGALAGLYAAFK